MEMHQLALNVAGSVAAAAAALVAVVVWAGLWWGWAALLAAVLLGAGAYAAVWHRMGARLEATRTLLEHLRAFEFEEAGKSNAARSSRRRPDELDVLLAEAHRTGRTLGEKMRDLRSMENYRREFIGNVSHELKTPIFSIRGFAETLLDGALEDESVRRSFVEKILRNADRLRRLARDLAEIARIETGELEMTVASFSLSTVIREVIESMEPAASAKRLDMQAEVPPDLPPVEGDRERLRQVLTNLIDNAIKYNERGGAVKVVARAAPGATVKTEVIDDGVGVAPEDVKRLTERFYRVDRSRSRKQGGTGLGLAIVKHILGAHDSELIVSSSPGRGSTFGFTLPVASAEDSVQVRAYGREGGMRANGQAQRERGEERQEKAAP